VPKISELNFATIPLQGDEQTVVVDDQLTKRVTVANLVRGGLLAAGDLDANGNNLVNANIIFTDPGRNVIPGTDLDLILDETDRALLNVRTTGIQFGGFVSTVSGNTVAVSAGRGAILDNSDPSDPSYYSVTWNVTNVALPDGTSWLYVNNAGAISSTLTEPTPTFRRLNIILARALVLSGSVAFIQQDVSPSQQGGHEWRDLAEIVGAAKPEGDLILSPTGANLQINLSAGTLFSPGAGGASITPHTVAFSAQAPITIRSSLRTGAIVSTGNNLDVGFYDVAGVRTAVPGATSRATVFTFFMAANGNIAALYGQNFYNTLADGVTSIRTRTFFAPINLRRTLIIGWVVATAGATNLSDPTQATFVAADSFGRPALVNYI